VERFTKEIAVGTETKLFEFTKMENVNGVKFFITSFDKDRKPFSFSLRQKDGSHWKLVPGSQRWLYDIEEELSNAIVETRLR
jgi:hypothetical protein